MHISSSLVATLWSPIPTFPVEAGVGLVGIGESTSPPLWVLLRDSVLHYASQIPIQMYTYERMYFITAIALYCYTKYCLESLLTMSHEADCRS